MSGEAGPKGAAATIRDEGTIGASMKLPSISEKHCLDRLKFSGVEHAPGRPFEGPSERMKVNIPVRKAEIETNAVYWSAGTDIAFSETDNRKTSIDGMTH